MNIIDQWNTLTDTQQLDMIGRCITKAAQRKGLRGYDIAEYVGGTWERLTAKLTPAALAAENSRRAAEGKQQITLVLIVYHAAWASIAAAEYDEHKHCAKIGGQGMDEDCESFSYIEATIASGRDNTEMQAVIKVDLERFTADRDATDRRILELAAGGYSEREIATAIGSITNVAVHKRLAKMRAVLAKAIN